ncbi:hypothetical protein SPRG_04646 [Saprolegnia parasitica CBS 223.65]|uniref:Uncharacterized protein n=1 Tax=Saprolegnia parasitica (strain CBS 223.65) TaxID=695850 RepID=A0A067CNE7_SAPPC|nr:hypothetical protein SPRG_04646 [Saprolegnia parasitica CBS 223.65]KDO30745.1 hypothetical protein SPRG_04646 [Saprolegnia parasitica CBS 223.65]|eukprot:XP_012198445.1 hypothetical protein SPRG_04646 [Saprolegnia parasitica CBS 223.65]
MGKYVCWVTKEHLEATLGATLDRARLNLARQTGYAIHAGDAAMATVVDEFHDTFSAAMHELIEASGEAMHLRGDSMMRLSDVLSASRARGAKIYGFDDATDDTSRAARLDPTEDVDMVDTTEEPSSDAHDAILYERATSESSSSDDSDDDSCSWKGSSGEDGASFGEGEESDVETGADSASAPSVVSPTSLYWLPRRLILRLYRDTCAEIHMTAYPITRKALSALHNLLEGDLERLLAKHLYTLAELEQTAYVARIEQELQEAKEEIRMTTPKLLRRSKRRLSGGDVVGHMATEAQRRKSPRRAKENTTPLRNKLSLMHVGRQVMISP